MNRVGTLAAQKATNHIIISQVGDAGCNRCNPPGGKQIAHILYGY